jgi:prepilin-type N-terminal cleavage/methylation domain-containing protein
MQQRSRKPAGFTLVELLVVIAIIGVLVALLLPAVQAAREAARRSSCSNNLKNLGLAMHNYHDTNNAFPYGDRLTGNSRTFGWTARILPFIEQQPLYDRINWSASWSDTTPVNGYYNKQIQSNKINVFLCPSATNDKTTSDLDGTTPAYTFHYVGIMGPDGTNAMTGTYYTCTNCISGGVTGHGGFAQQGMLNWEKAQTMANVTDGLSNTLMLGELSWNKANCFRVWTRGTDGSYTTATKNIRYAIKAKPYTTEFNNVSMGSEHPGGAMFANGDASVRFVTANMAMNLYLAAASANGGEPSIEN